MSCHDCVFGITHTACYLPERIDDVHSWGRRTGQSAASVERLRRAGVQRYRDAAGEPVASMATKAIDALMRASGVAPDTVDCLVYTHTLQGSIAPPPMSLPRMLCNASGFARAGAFSFAQQHCASALGALRIIRAMFIARPRLTRVVLVGADAMPLASERLMEGIGLIGDGACAALIERDASINRFIALRTCASGYAWRGALSGEETRLAGRYFLTARQLIQEVTHAAGFEPCVLQCIVPHHLDLPGWYRVLSSLGIPSERLFSENFSRIAHVTVSDPIINLSDCTTLTPNEPFLLFASGVGGFSAAALLRR